MSGENEIKEKEMDVIYEINWLKIKIKALYFLVGFLICIFMITTFLISFNI